MITFGSLFAGSVDVGRKGGGCRSLESDVASLGESGPLNPEWVEWLMGFPVGWTELPHSETLSSPK